MRVGLALFSALVVGIVGALMGFAAVVMSAGVLLGATGSWIALPAFLAGFAGFALGLFYGWRLVWRRRRDEVI